MKLRGCFSSEIQQIRRRISERWVRNLDKHDDEMMMILATYNNTMLTTLQATAQDFSPFLSRWSSDVRRPMSAMERTIGRRFASFFWFWWWCCFRRVSRTFSLSSSPSGEYNSWWSNTISKAEDHRVSKLKVPLQELLLPETNCSAYQQFRRCCWPACRAARCCWWCSCGAQTDCVETAWLRRVYSIALLRPPHPPQTSATCNESLSFHQERPADGKVAGHLS